MKTFLANLTVTAALWIAPAACVVAQTDDVALAADTAAVADDAVVLLPDTAGVVAGTDPDEMFGVPHEPYNGDALPDPTHHIRPAEWIVPSSAAVLGALCVNTAWGKRVRNEMHEMLGAEQKLHTKVDNYLQYAPMVMAYGAYFAGWKGQHNLKDRTILLAMSAATMAAVVNVSKRAFKEQRPDSGAKNSFPSGHTATAFMGAEFLWQEYRTTQPWLGYTGYGLAALTGYLRMHNERHWVNDVVAGAAIGMLSTKFAYWLYPKIFHEGSSRGKGAKKRKVTAFGVPYCSSEGAGVNMALVF